jgi:acyl phosphate:glycerol-3-phosphate acyltransferase
LGPARTTLIERGARAFDISAMLIVLVIAYLIGSIPFALILTRYRGADLRRVGSGNLGAANVMRASGLPAGLTVAMLDMAKGAVSVLVAEWLTPAAPATSIPALAGVAAVAGHVYPIWLRFRGGKGVATACGAFSVLTPAAIPVAVAVFAVTVWITRYVSAGSVLATMVLPPAAVATDSPAPAVAAAVAVASLIVFRHRSNIARLRTGTERRLGARL